MGKHSSYYRREPQKKKPLNPIWRGIGFLLMILTPIIAYAGTLVLIDLNGKYSWLIIPLDWLAKGEDPLLYVKIGTMLVLMIVVFAIFTLINYIIYGLFGPPKYGPMDAPPISYKRRKR